MVGLEIESHMVDIDHVGSPAVANACPGSAPRWTTNTARHYEKEPDHDAYPVTSDKLPPLGGPFSPGVQSGSGPLFISGQVGQDPATGALVDGDVTVQAHHALRNLTAVLEAAGKSLNDVVRIGVYLTDMGDFAAMNEVYREHLGAPYPARTAIAVARTLD